MQERDRLDVVTALEAVDDEEAFTVAEVAERLRMGRDAVYARIKDGRLRAIQDGLTRIPRAAVRDYLNASASPTASTVGDATGEDHR